MILGIMDFDRFVEMLSGPELFLYSKGSVREINNRF